MDTALAPRTETEGGAALRVLLVEDDPSIAEPLAEGLEHEGFEVQWVATGADALAAEAGDVVLLDLGLPDLDGREVCRRLRDRSRVPIIVVTARDDEIDRVLLLEMAADDYVVKPFGFRELVARIRAVHRRSVAVDAPEPGNDDAGPLRIDRRARRVWHDGNEVELTPKEFDLLALLTDEPGVARRGGDHRQRLGRELVGADQDTRRSHRIAAPQAREPRMDRHSQGSRIPVRSAGLTP